MKHHFSILFFLLASVGIFGQSTVKVSGTIFDKNQDPLAGVSVYVSNTSKAVFSDEAGHYSIEVAEGETITFSIVGFEKKFITASVANPSVDVILQESSEAQLAEVVVIGYSRQERRDLTGSVSTVRLAEDKAMLTVDQLLIGQAPGVFASSSSGALGAANLLTIRGVASIMGDNNPLYVIDGVPIYGTDRNFNSTSTHGGAIAGVAYGGMQVGGGSLNYNIELNNTFEKNPLAALNPDDIESIEILKDAFATAIYGSRGSAGVILITTKKGSREKAKVNLTYSVSADRPLGKLNLLNGDEYSTIYSMYYPSASFPKGVNTDWIDAVTRTAISHNVSATLSGGSEKTHYYVSISNADNESYIINNKFSRFSARVNLDSKLSKHWSFGLSASLARMNNNAIAAPTIYSLALKKAPNLPIYNEDGSYAFGYRPNTMGYADAYNPVAAAYMNTEYAQDFRTIGHIYLQYEPFTWMTLRSEIGTDMSNAQNYVKKAELPAHVVGVPNNQAQESVRSNYRVVVNNTLNINKIIGKHFFQGVAGQSYEFADEYSNSISGSNFFSPDLIGVGAAQVKRVGSSGTQNWALFSAFARFNYQFLRRYMAGVTYRIDGSSRFNRFNRYLGTPSVSAGWRISEEKFISDNCGWIDDLKLRGSVGWSSKDGNLGYYGAQAVYSLGNVNYGSYNYLMMSQPGNVNLSWERTITYDVGLDFTLLKNRIGVTLDYYYRKTTDMLFPSDLPAYTGHSKQSQNIADMSNQGVEFQLKTENIQSRDFSWMTILNFSSNTNKILRLNFEGNQLDQANSSFKYYAVGYPMGQWYLHEWAGVDPSTGNPLWKLADGTLTDMPPAANYATSTANKKICGTALPLLYGGFTNQFFYKNIDLSFLFSFSYGGKMINSTKAVLMTYTTEDAFNLSKDVLKFWQIPGQETDVPMLKNKSIIGNYDYTAAVTTTRYMEDNSYIRLKNLSLGYTIPQKLLSKTNMFSRLKIFAIATNLFTLTPYSGLDPEVSAFGSSATASGYDNLTMPQTRSIQLGVRLEM